jgi:hypothetical protein
MGHVNVFYVSAIFEYVRFTRDYHEYKNEFEFAKFAYQIAMMTTQKTMTPTDLEALLKENRIAVSHDSQRGVINGTLEELDGLQWLKLNHDNSSCFMIIKFGEEYGAADCFRIMFPQSHPSYRNGLVIHKPSENSRVVRIVGSDQGCSIFADDVRSADVGGFSAVKLRARRIRSLSVITHGDGIECYHVDKIKILAKRDITLTSKDLCLRYLHTEQSEKQRELITFLHMIHHRQATFAGMNNE